MISIIRRLYKLFNVDRVRIIFISMFSSLLTHLMPTKGFLIALVIMFGFNIQCGIRVDGVSAIRCKNFKWDKSKNALVRLLLYLITTEVVFSFASLIGNGEDSLLAIKTITYVFPYVYLQNVFKNLIAAYPRNKGLRITYHVIRFESKWVTPTHVQGVIDRIENELDKEERYENIDW